MIGSEDEIRLINRPQGTYQIRGIEAEKLVAQLSTNLHTSALELGKETIDSFINQYEGKTGQTKESDGNFAAKYAATLSLVDCLQYDKLAAALDNLAEYLIARISHRDFAKAALISINSSLQHTQNYPSFLNLEYYDLQDFLENLGKNSNDLQLISLCNVAIGILQNELILYERHTQNNRSHGLSIFMPSFQVPENIYQSHLHMYNRSSFAKENSWVKLIDIYRRQMLLHHGEILLDYYELAYLHSDTVELDRLNARIPWAIQKDILRGNLATTERYFTLLKREKIDHQYLRYIDNALNVSATDEQKGRVMLKTLQSLHAF